MSMKKIVFTIAFAALSLVAQGMWADEQQATSFDSPSGYYRLHSLRSGYLYLEGETPAVSVGKALAASSVVHIQRAADGGCYLSLQGRYLRTPLKDQIVTVSDIPEKFYPVAGTTGDRVAFTTYKGAYSVLCGGTKGVIGSTLDDAASYWAVEPATDFTIAAAISDDDLYYTTSAVPFVSAAAEGTEAYAVTTAQDGDTQKALCTPITQNIPAGAGVLLRGQSKTLAMSITDEDHALVAPNMALRNDYADLSWKYFNKAFLLYSGEGKDNTTYYRTDLSTTSNLYFWQQALVILAVEDRYQFRGDKRVASLIIDLLDAFVAHEGETWTWNNYNDDLLWAGLAFVRGYLITGQQRFLDKAVNAWNLLYKRGYDSTLGGGIWWSVDKEEKSGLSNNPAICMACYLYEATGDEQYLDIAKDLYDWVCKTLRKSDGAVAEKVDADGTVSTSYNVYNMGTFIEGVAGLYRITKNLSYISVARKTIEYVMVNCVTSKGLLSAWKTDGTWQSEFSRGMAFYLQTYPRDWTHRGYYTKSKGTISYYKWLRMNADAAWETRDTVNNITGCKWEELTPTQPTSSTVWECDACVSSVAMTNVVPEVEPGSSQETYVDLDDNSEMFDQYDPSEEAGAEEAFEKDDDGIVRVPAPVSIVCVGNSITEGYGLSSGMYAWPAQLQKLLGDGYSVLNCGVSGTTLSRGGDVSYWNTSRYTTAKKTNPQILIIALGTNDADPNRWSQYGADFKKDYLAMVEEFRAGGAAPIIYCTLAPPLFPITRSQNVNVENNLMPQVRELAETLGAHVIDFHTSLTQESALFPDGTHPNVEGAGRLAALAAEAIRKVQIIQPSITVGEGKVYGGLHAVCVSGTTVTLSPTATEGGSWQWTGPDSFSSTQREVTLTNVTKGGVYKVAFTAADGHRSTLNFLVSIADRNASALTPYAQVAGGSWQQTTELKVPAGATVYFGPQYQSSTSGTWTWHGPDGFVWVGRDPSVPDFDKTKAGKYAVTYTDDEGRQNTAVVDVQLIQHQLRTLSPSLVTDALETEADRPDSVASDLVGVFVNTKVVKGNAILKKGGNGVGFYPLTSTTTVKANAAYLPTDMQSLLDFGGEDGIEAVSDDSNTPNTCTWTLDGRRTTARRPGLYITNGHKVLVAKRRR